MRGERPPVGRCTAAIVLSRTAWEAFLNEFIEWRGLDPSLKDADFRESLAGVLASLGAPEPALDAGGVWEDLAIVNALRNKLVHFQAKAYPTGGGPRQLIQRLSALCGLLPTGEPDYWERILLVPPVAQWACRVVGTSIIRIESIPTRRTRLVRDIARTVLEALSPIAPRRVE